VGVIQVLRERGIEPSLIVGTSAGAIIGGALAAGMDPYALEALVVKAQWADFGTLPKTPGFGVLDTAGLRTTIITVGGDRNIEDLGIRFAAIATDLVSRDSVVIDRGSLADALAASISVPGLFRPSRIEGKVLVDGGLLQNLPLEAAFNMGAQHVIGVRLAPEWDNLPSFRTSTEVHSLELRNDVTLVHPRLEARSQWVPRGIHGLVALGREAAEKAFAEYPVIRPRPDVLTHGTS
jgi:NTE family protein